MKLYKHNQTAYERIMDAFEHTNRAAIVHATGTGKSLICAEVSKHFKKVLIIAPNNFVLNETRKWCGDNCDFVTYSSNLYEQKVGYDLIVFDEFHRAGAPQWGKGVEKLIQANSSAKFLGMSATNIRYLDGERNMADELFDGNVVSELLLPDAIKQGILPSPTYVSSIYNIDENYKALKNKIATMRRIGKKDREKDLASLVRTTQSWQNAHGVPTIIRKYYPSDTRRIIVFTSQVGHFDETRKMLSNWFTSAGYSHLDFYRINYTEPNVEKEMQRFQDDSQFERKHNPVDLKIAISVDMLNEGVHIPRVDGIIMLRGTISRIILEQQVGRCLTADNKSRTPIVLDLVNNMDSIRYGGVNYNDGLHNEGEQEKIDYAFPFNVIDECRDICIFYQQMSNLYSIQKVEGSFSDRLRDVLDWVKKNRKAPPKGDMGELHDISCTYAWARTRYKNGVLSENDAATMDEIVAITDKSLVDRMDAVIEYIKNTGKAPKKGSDVGRAWAAITKKKSDNRMSAEESAKYEVAVSYMRDTYFEDIAKPRLEKFYAEHGRLPYPSEDMQMAHFMANSWHVKGDLYAPRIEFLKAHHYKECQKVRNTTDENTAYLKAYLETHDFRMPAFAEDKRMHQIVQNYKRYIYGGRTPKNMNPQQLEEVKSLIERIKPAYSINDRLSEIEAKYAGVKVPKSADRGCLNKLLRNGGLTEEQHARVVALLGHDETNIKRTSNLALVEFIETNKRLPTYKDDRKIYNKLMKFKTDRSGDNPSRRNDPETYSVLVKYGFDADDIKRRKVC